jgi:two-component system OmpR family sensor kinase
MSLRGRLILVTVAVVAVALVVADVGAYLALRSFLMERAGQDLASAATSSKVSLKEHAAGGSTRAEDAAAILLGGSPYVAYALYDASGTLLGQAAVVGNDKVALSRPLFPALRAIPRLDPGEREPVVTSDGASVVVPAASGGFDYLVTSLASKGGAVLLVAYPLDQVAATLGRLATIEVLVTIAVIAFVAIASTRLVALALRPLGGIEDTASRIAAGDLGQRIAPIDARTEVGRLGIALNTMLGRIEAALTAREASEQRLRRLVTDASHELRTPLTSLRGYAELFRRGAGERPADLAKAMRGIELESERMALLVDELLLLARLDEGQPLAATDEDLVPVVRAAVDAARAVEPDRPLEVRVPTEAIVRADGARMRQVVDNLLANVRVHTPQGTPASVTVRKDADRVILEVADVGPGMSETASARAFERFFRADPSRSRDSGGSGLGLAIVAAIARAYGGVVAIDSVAGQGTTVSIDWPAAGPPDAARHPA